MQTGGTRSAWRLVGYALCVGLAVALAAAPPPDPNPPDDGPDWALVADQLEAQLQRAQGATAGVARDVLDSNLPLAALETEKLRLRLQQPWRDGVWRGEQEVSYQTAADALDRFRRGVVGMQRLTGAEQPSGYLTRAYRALPDDSPQPYYLRLPDGYDPARPWPMIVFLHGYMPETSKIYPWVLGREVWDALAARGYITVFPHGRRNTDFLGVGEVDVWQTIAEMQRWYAVDADRIHLTGCSMGGYGAWAIGLRHPDRFASLGIMAGHTDFFLWEQRRRDEVPFKTWLVARNNPVDLAVNARHLPAYVQHGELDSLVPVAHSRLMVPLLNELGYTVRYDELADQVHEIYLASPPAPFERLADWCDQYQRVVAPTTITFRTYTPHTGRAYWTEIRRLQRWGPPAELTAELADGAVTLTTDNVAELWLHPVPGVELVGRAVTVNGQAAGTLGEGSHRLRIGEAVTLAAAEPPAHPPRTGPAREVFNRPFLVVYPTTGDAERVAQARERVDYFARLWWAFAEGVPQVVADAELTEAQVREHNLVIFGEPDLVTLPGIPNPAATLPEGVTMAHQHYQAAGREYAGDNLGIYLLVDHPLNDQGQILWCSGIEYGRGLPINHQFDLIPDLLIYIDRYAWDGANLFEVGGFLSQDGTVDPTLLQFGAPPGHAAGTRAAGAGGRP